MARVRRRWRVPKFCSVCGSPRARDERFCVSCGVDFVKLDAGEVAEESAAPAAATVVAASPAAAPSVAAPPPAAPPPPPPQPAYAAPPPPPSQPTYAPPPPASYPPPAQPLAQRPLFTTQVGRVELNFRPLPLLAGIASIVAPALTWLDVTRRSQSAFKVPFDFLFHPLTANGGFKLGVALLIVAIAATVLSILPNTALLRRLCGVAVLAGSVAFAVQLARVIHDGQGGVGDFFNALGVGVYVAIAGGFLLATQR